VVDRGGGGGGGLDVHDVLCLVVVISYR
jgi:hypothetical protein